MFQKFPSILQFREVKRNVEFDAQYRGLDENEQPIMDRTAELPVIHYTGTVKLHGTNAAINYTSDVEFQSRENIITPDKDNAGFATWGSQLPESFHNSIKKIYGDNIVIFGEWCGGNIQKGVAISGLPKMFVIFAIQQVSDDENNEVWLDLEGMRPEYLNQYGIYVSTQFGIYIATVDFNNPEPILDFINAKTLEVEKSCPAGCFFGKQGIGEGIVWIPSTYSKIRSRLVFKTKGEAHAKSGVKKLAAVNPDKVKSVEAFLDKHVNEERLNQGYAWLAEKGHPQNEKSTGHFVKWIVEDITKEEKDELLYSGLTEKEVNSSASNKARKWFFQKFNK